MNFQNLTKVEKADTYLDIAIKASKKTVEKTREKSFGNRFNKSKAIETDKIKTIKKTLSRALTNIIKAFPSFDELPDFYKGLVKITVDYRQLKKSLGAVDWANKKIIEMYVKYNEKLKNCQQMELINKHRKEFIGRISSIIKQINDELIFLEQTRRIMRSYPSIKTSLKTIAISGYPNVGKSTLLKALTTAKPEIKSYAFTTKRINLGYLMKNNEKIQIVDTPGTFDRKFEEMNNVEKQAYLVLKHVAQKVLFLVDPTETCGYSLEKQLKLYENIKKQFKHPITLIVNKIDMQNRKEVKEKCISISAEKKIGIKEIEKII